MREAIGKLIYQHQLSKIIHYECNTITPEEINVQLPLAENVDHQKLTQLIRHHSIAAAWKVEEIHNWSTSLVDLLVEQEDHHKQNK